MREYLPLSITFTFEDILPFIKQVENDILIPVLSQALYDILQSKITNNVAFTSEETDLLSRCRAVIAPLAVVCWLPFGQVQVNSAGVQIASNTEMKTAFGWQVEKLEISATELGYSCLETLQNYLLASSFTTLWITTNEFKALYKFFINDVTLFRGYAAILKSRYSFEAIKGIMQRVEDNQILGTIGQEQFDSIKADILATSVSQENAALLRFIWPAVANLTMNEALVELGSRIDSYGVTFYTGTVNNKQVNKQDANTIGIMQNNAQSAGNNYLKQLSDYLYKNADTYPLFKNSDVYVPPSDSSFTQFNTPKGTYFTG